MKEYYYIKGKEILDYLDVINAKEGIWVEHGFESYVVDQSCILRKTEEETFLLLNKCKFQDNCKLYIREKVKRQPIFSEKLDKLIEELLSDYLNSIECGDYLDSDKALDDFLSSLSIIVKAK